MQQLDNKIYKIKNRSKRSFYNINIYFMYYLFISSIYIIFFNYKQLLNVEMYQFKNFLYQLNINSKVLLKQYRLKIFNKSFKFLGGTTFCIFVDKYEKFLNVFNFLLEKKILFFFSYKKKISNIITDESLFSIINNKLGGKVFILINFIIFKLLCNIIILILFCIIIIIKYLNFKI